MGQMLQTLALMDSEGFKSMSPAEQAQAMESIGADKTIQVDDTVVQFFADQMKGHAPFDEETQQFDQDLPRMRPIPVVCQVGQKRRRLLTLFWGGVERRGSPVRGGCFFGARANVSNFLSRSRLG